MFYKVTIKLEIHKRLSDPSISVREIALDLLGKYLVISQDNISVYCDMIIESTTVSTLFCRVWSTVLL
jgi:hypothetical protein